MTRRHPPDPSPRIRPEQIQLAVRRAHALRDQAIDDVIRGVGRWCAALFARRETLPKRQPHLNSEAQACRS